ncbi:hypothetical protein VNO80_21262 [Phaseolus coccineus]|uniref:Uncharacterized protein n=1 Tax=Phaseolus coccineus TaxID=3886 RepID=A0AAN9M2X6_PHACN
MLFFPLPLLSSNPTLASSCTFNHPKPIFFSLQSISDPLHCSPKSLQIIGRFHRREEEEEFIAIRTRSFRRRSSQRFETNLNALSSTRAIHRRNESSCSSI